MVSPALASVLRSGRADFNAEFAAARRVHPDLQAEAFSHFLETTVNELVLAVEKVRPERLAEVTQTAFSAGLELIGQKLAGPGARLAAVEEGWRRILPKVAAVVSESPGRLIPAVCNALHQLTSSPDARPAEWIDAMERLGPNCSDGESFLKLGQVCAWRAGLAHFRTGALTVADTLPPSLALAALNATDTLKWAELRTRLVANPWFDPAKSSRTSLPARVVARVGTFRGYGGLFPEPPLVTQAHQNFLVRSNSECWLLTADAFGATFHRASAEEFEAAFDGSPPSHSLKVSRSRVTLNGSQIELPELGQVTSAAVSDTTAAFTFSGTHSIVLVALV